MAQHHNDGGNARAKENVGGQTDDGVNMVVLNQIFADRAFLTAAEQNTVGQNDGHNAIRLDMVKVVQQIGIVRLTLGCQTKAGIAGVAFLVGGIPCLRIRRVRYYGIYIQRVIGVDGVGIIKVGPVLLQRIAVAGNDVVRLDAAHYQIHTGQIVGVLFQLLRVVFYIVCVSHILGNAFADIDQQRAGTAGRVIDFDFVLALQMACHDFGHQQRNLVGRIELARLFAGIGGKHTDKIFIDEAQHIIALLAVHRNILDQVQQAADGFGLGAGAVAQFGKTGFQCVEDFLKHTLVRGGNQPAERRQRVTHIGNIKILAHAEPGGEEIFVGDKIADVFLHPFDGFGVVLGYGFQQLIVIIVVFQKFDFFIGQIFIKNETKDKVFVLTGLDFGAHLVSRSPNLLRKLLFVHRSSSFCFRKYPFLGKA